jgi:hypothetical protein
LYLKIRFDSLTDKKNLKSVSEDTIFLGFGSAAMKFHVTDVDWDEAVEYRPGQRVELKSNPGMVDTIAQYDPLMVPPIWLEHDPRPRYPHELQVVSSWNPVRTMWQEVSAKQACFNRL